MKIMVTCRQARDCTCTTHGRGGFPDRGALLDVCRVTAQAVAALAVADGIVRGGGGEVGGLQR